MKHFVGVQLTDASVFVNLLAGEPSSTIGGIYEDLIAQETGIIRVFDTNATFHDVGTPLDYLNTNHTIAKSEGRASLNVGINTAIHPSAQLPGTVVWDRVTVGSNCKLHDCIITDDVRIPDGVTLARQMCISDKHMTGLGSGTRLGNAIVYPIK